MYVLAIRETLLLSYICKKMSESQWKAFLGFQLKGGWKREEDYYHKPATKSEGVNLPMVNKHNNSCISKTHILSFMTPTLLRVF